MRIQKSESAFYYILLQFLRTKQTKLSSELVINSTQKGERIALLRDRSLIEMHFEGKDSQFTVGDIFLGVIKKVQSGLNAAFVDIGYEKDAFLHYQDLGANYRTVQRYMRFVESGKVDLSYKSLGKFPEQPQLNKLGKIAEVLKQNQKILVQVLKEPISTKGPRLTCEISLAGRYIVLVPFSDAISISKKIGQQGERKRLMRLMSSIKPEGFGVIIRTVAEGKEVAELDRDLRDLLAKWDEGMNALVKAKPKQKIIGEVSRTSSMLRDMLNESFDSITIDNEEIYDEVRNYIRTIAPDKESIVKQYTGKAKIFESFGIEKQLKQLFGQSVSLPEGGYLIIEHTEALHVIDVNSGNKSNSEETQEQTAFHVNLAAASEIARQLRLRDMGGIIVVDFIDMKKAEHKREVYEHMKQEMKTDRSRHTVLPLTKFGLMQITRQRVRPELSIVTNEKCPTCAGSGKISASINAADIIESQVHFLLAQQNEKGLSLAVHPYIHAYFRQGLPSLQMKWYLKHHKWVKLIKDSSLGLLEYHFYSKNKEEIKLEH